MKLEIKYHRDKHLELFSHMYPCSFPLVGECGVGSPASLLVIHKLHLDVIIENQIISVQQKYLLQRRVLQNQTICEDFVFVRLMEEED